jgi:hypothetical protein
MFNNKSKPTLEEQMRDDNDLSVYINSMLMLDQGLDLLLQYIRTQQCWCKLDTNNISLEVEMLKELSRLIVLNKYTPPGMSLGIEEKVRMMWGAYIYLVLTLRDYHQHISEGVDAHDICAECQLIIRKKAFEQYIFNIRHAITSEITKIRVGVDLINEYNQRQNTKMTDDEFKRSVTITLVKPDTNKNTKENNNGC